MVLGKEACLALVLLDKRELRLEDGSGRQHGTLIVRLCEKLRAKKRLVAATFALLLIA